MQMEAEFANRSVFHAEMNHDSAPFETGMKQIVRIQENDHTKLSNRDAPDQHPMGSITGLDTSLEAKVSAGDALTNLEIETLLGGM